MEIKKYPGIIDLTNNNITTIPHETIIGYVLIGGNPYGVEGRVYIFTVIDNIFRTYRGNVYHGLDRKLLYTCIPRATGFFEHHGHYESMHPKGWKMIPYYMGHYCFFPETLADAVSKIWEDMPASIKGPEKRMREGVYLGLMEHKEITEDIKDIREKLIDVFKDTQKFYAEDRLLAEAVEYGRTHTKLYQPDNYPELQFPLSKVYDSKIRVTKKKTFESAMKLRKEFPDKKIAVLSFASATKPGGGVWSGSRAQEESLCRCSTLYSTIDRKWLWAEYYDVNREAKDVRHSDACIYSPGVVICKTDERIPRRLYPKEYVTVDVISCAAPNLRKNPVTLHNPETGKPVSMTPDELFKLHYLRAQHILHIAAYNHVDLLVLGAFGCGAFENNPKVVAKAFEKALTIYRGWFDLVEFAIYCRGHEVDNYNAFHQTFSKKSFTEIIND